MAITYFPRLNTPHASAIIESLKNKSVLEAAESAAVEHESSYDYATALKKVDRNQLLNLREKIVEIAKKSGYPASLKKGEGRDFDYETAHLLDASLELIPSEAANTEVWNFFTLVLLPDVAMWRYPNTNNNPHFERWIGTPRNVFRKLWWREAVLGRELNTQIGEDESVAIMERPNLAANPSVARAMVKAFIKVRENLEHGSRSDLMRACALRTRSVYAITTFEVLSEKEIDELIFQIFTEARKSFIAKADVNKPKASG